LLPLIENAIEAAPEDGEIGVMQSETPTMHMFCVSNTIREPLKLDDGMFERFTTTKTGHEGLGLSTVKYLLSAHEGASLSYTSTDKHTMFSVHLPRKSEPNERGNIGRR